MNIYEELGVTPVINAAGTYTIVGGSRMSAQTLQAMQEAAEDHVLISELQNAVQAKIAQMTHNEAAVVCNGAAAGLYLCALSALALKHGKKARYLTRGKVNAGEIVALAAHHIPYDYVLRQLGVKQTWVGYPNIHASTSIEDVENAIGEHTAALFYYVSSPYGLATPGAVPLEQFIQLGERYKLPVVVDAAAQLPPKSNLWDFTKQGATVAIFSGGKDLRGPQSSGLIVGKKDFLKIVQETNFPNYGFGRMLKTGREEIAGLYAALKEYLLVDEGTRARFAENCVNLILETFAKSTLYVMKRAFPNEAGQPLPYVAVQTKKRLPLEAVARAMLEGSPSVFIKPEGDQFFINPMTLQETEVNAVIAKLQSVEKRLSM